VSDSGLDRLKGHWTFSIVLGCWRMVLDPVRGTFLVPDAGQGTEGIVVNSFSARFEPSR